MQIQNIYKCKYYTNNENMNKTCKNKKMCKVYYDEVCEEYRVEENEILDTDEQMHEIKKWESDYAEKQAEFYLDNI